MDSANALRDMCEKRSKELTKSMDVQVYHYELSSMTVFFRGELNSGTSAVSSVLVDTDGQKEVLSGIMFMVLSDRHGCSVDVAGERCPPLGRRSPSCESCQASQWSCNISR